MSKRIAFLDLLFHYPPTGGSWVDLYEVATRLQNKGNDVCMFVPDFTPFFQRGVIRDTLPFPVKSIAFSKYSFNRQTAPERFLKALDEYQPDYVFIGDGYFLKPHLVNAISKKYKVILRFYAYEILCGLNNLYQPQLKKNCDYHLLKNPFRCWGCLNWNFRTYKTSLKLLLGRNTDSYKMHFGQEYLASTAFSPTYPTIVRRALKAASHIIVYNQFIADILKPYSDQVQITPSGVDCRRFCPRQKSNASGIKKILFSGRVDDPVKGLKYVLEACQALWKKRQDFELLLTSSDPKYLEYPFVKNTGWLKQEDLADLYQSVDICLAPSLWREAFGITALEAMASGLPVIATKMGGLIHTVKDNETGFLVEPFNSAQLLSRMEQLLDNEELRAQMGTKARQRAVNEFDWDIIINRYYVPLIN